MESFELLKSNYENWQDVVDGVFRELFITIDGYNECLFLKDFAQLFNKYVPVELIEDLHEFHTEDIVRRIINYVKIHETYGDYVSRQKLIKYWSYIDYYLLMDSRLHREVIQEFLIEAIDVRRLSVEHIRTIIDISREIDIYHKLPRECIYDESIVKVRNILNRVGIVEYLPVISAKDIHTSCYDAIVRDCLPEQLWNIHPDIIDYLMDYLRSDDEFMELCIANADKLDSINALENLKFIEEVRRFVHTIHIKDLFDKLSLNTDELIREVLSQFDTPYTLDQLEIVYNKLVKAGKSPLSLIGRLKELKHPELLLSIPITRLNNFTDYITLLNTLCEEVVKGENPYLAILKILNPDLNTKALEQYVDIQHIKELIDVNLVNNIRFQLLELIIELKQDYTLLGSQLRRLTLSIINSPLSFRLSLLVTEALKYYKDLTIQILKNTDIQWGCADALTICNYITKHLVGYTLNYEDFQLTQIIPPFSAQEDVDKFYSVYIQLGGKEHTQLYKDLIKSLGWYEFINAVEIYSALNLERTELLNVLKTLRDTFS